jgi:hypothetical protein
VKKAVKREWLPKEQKYRVTYEDGSTELVERVKYNKKPFTDMRVK